MRGWPRRCVASGMRLAAGAVRLRSNKWMHVSNIACSADKSSGSTHLQAHRQRSLPGRLRMRRAKLDGMGWHKAAPALKRLFSCFLQEPPAEPDQRLDGPMSM